MKPYARCVCNRGRGEKSVWKISPCYIQPRDKTLVWFAKETFADYAEIFCEGLSKCFNKAVAWGPHKSQTKPRTRHSSKSRCWECSIVCFPNYLCVCSFPYREHREAQLSMKEHPTRCQTLTAASQGTNGEEKSRKGDKAHAEVKYRRMGLLGAPGTWSGVKWKN